MTVQVESWGADGVGNFEVRVANGKTPLAAALAKVEKLVGQKIYNCQSHGHSVKGGKIERSDYQLTLGKSSKLGGIDITGELWIGIHIDPPAKVTPSA